MLSHPAPLRLRLADPADLDRVLALLEAARGWLTANGMAGQWSQPFPPDLMAERIAQGQVYLGLIGEVPVGTFTLLWDDAEVWGEQPDDAGYVHSLAIDRAYQGLRVGAALLDAAGALVAQRRRWYVRLDCWARNTRLCQYYERNGFQGRGRIHLVESDPEDEFLLQRYERPVACERAKACVLPPSSSL